MSILDTLLVLAEDGLELLQDKVAAAKSERAEAHAAAQADLDFVDGRPAAPMPTEHDAPHSSDSDLP